MRKYNIYYYYKGLQVFKHRHIEENKTIAYYGLFYFPYKTKEQICLIGKMKRTYK